MTYSEFEEWVKRGLKKARRISEERQREWERDPDYDGREFEESFKFWASIMRDVY